MVTVLRALGVGPSNLRALMRQQLDRPSLVFWFPILGVLLASTAVGEHFALDDHVLGLLARGERMSGLLHGRWDLFCFTNGDRAVNRQLMEQGLLLPWWSDPDLKVTFYRPLSSLLHRIDFALWSEAPRAMYWQGLLWFGLVLALAARLYRELESSTLLAGLATVLFSLDDSHAGAVAWLSNRNALVATAFGLATLLAHHDWRARGRSVSALVAVLAWLVALSAGEFAIATLAYLGAYALFLDRAKRWRRSVTLLPYLVILAGWGLGYGRSGAGVQGSASYVSPWADFSGFAHVLPTRLASLLGAALGPIPSEMLLFGRPSHATAWALAGMVFASTVVGACWPLLRSDPTARFWLVGMVLACVPVTASFPSDRLLLFVTVGGMGLIARVTAPLFDRRAWGALGARGMALPLFFGGVHLLLAPLSLPLRAAQMKLLSRTLSQATRSFDRLPDLEHRTVVIINAPLDILASYIQAERALRRVPRPEHLYWLTTAASALRVTRQDARTLLVERSDGFLSTPLERHYRRNPSALTRGAQVQLGPLTAKVLSVTRDQRPEAVSFHFAEPLESRSYIFLVWKSGSYQLLPLETLNQPLQLPAEDLPRILLSTALEDAGVERTSPRTPG